MGSDARARWATISLIVLRAVMAAAALYTFEPVSNCFKRRRHRSHWGKEEVLFFSNIAMVYTVLGVAAGLLRDTAPVFAAVHDFVVPTATVLDVVVAAIFWGLFLFRRELVLRTNGGPGMWPVLRECPKHLFPLGLLGQEHWGRVFLKSLWQRVFLCVFCVVYFCICEVLIHREKNYLYPFFEHLSYWNRALLFLTALVIMLVLYEILLERPQSWKASKSTPTAYATL